ncbi:MAG: hypothetical protein ACK5RL_18320 [Acidimicrobiales bacterium]
MIAKIYGWSWLSRFGLEPKVAAATLRSHGVTGVVVQNHLAPTPVSAVSQHGGPNGGVAFDHAFRDALNGENLAYYEAFPVFLDTPYLFHHPGAAPRTHDGLRMVQEDWYLGLAPEYPGLVEWREAQMARIVAELEPDGVFLDWIRYPGFWEMWNPGERVAEYCCYGPVEGPPHDHPAPGTPEATEWRCEWIGAVVDRLAAAAARAAAARQLPPPVIVANLVGIGANVVDNGAERLLGQRPSRLAVGADVVATMAYHQVRGTDPYLEVIRSMAAATAGHDRPVWACIQATAVEPAIGPRISPSGRVVTIDQHEAAIAGAVDSGAQGLMVFHWERYLEAEAAGDHRWAEQLQAFGATP